MAAVTNEKKNLNSQTEDVSEFIMLLKQMSAEGLDRSELAKKASIPPFALGKYQAQCRKFTLADLRQAVEDCVDTEEQVKTGRMGDQLGVELLIMKYTEKNSGH